MAQRVVTVLERRTSAMLVASLAVSALSACSSFNPIGETRYTLLNDDNFGQLGMVGPYWHLYDDQHSHTSPCTNGATGNHEPAQCARIDAPLSFEWDGRKCPPSDDQKDDLARVVNSQNGRICLQGMLDGVLPCVVKDGPRCKDNGGDTSNMWGAGIGLEFNQEPQEWDAVGRGFRGVAFDLTIFPAGGALNLRVELPVALAGDTLIPEAHPLMRGDGSVIATDGRVYSYSCELNQLVPSLQMQRPIELCDAVVPYDKDCRATSYMHPSGSPFWVSTDRDPTYRPSPILHEGHNEFEWDDVTAPPGSGYDFNAEKMLGIHFHVVHTENNKEEIAASSGFHFCIENLALLPK